MKPQHIALAWFLILVTVGVIIVLSIAIVIRRGVARRKSRIDRNVYTPYGYGLSKAWKESVERRINNTVRIRTEPRVLNDHYQENWDKYIQEKDITFLFRAKAVDEFLQLKESILTLCPELESPPIRGIHAFLMTAREKAMSPAAPRMKIEEYCRLYLWARHDLDAFGKEQYEQFHTINSELVQYVATAIRNSGPPNTPSNSSRRGSSRLFSFGSRTTSFTKIHALQSGKSSTGISKSHSGLSIHMLGSSGTNNSAKPKPSQLDPMQLSHHRRLQRDHDEMSGPRSTGICSTTVDELITVHVPENDSVQQHMACMSRRDSCRSDGSQTALIDMDPVVRIPSKGPGNVTLSRSRSNEAFETIELRPMLHCHTDDLPGSGITSSTSENY